jgi:hypothetical protein
MRNEGDLMSKEYTLGVVLLLACLASCGDGRKVSVVKDPPELALVSEVPLYTQAKSLSLTVEASSVAGTKHVWCAFNNGAVTEAEKGDPLGRNGLSVVNATCQGGLVQNTANVVAIWAEDYLGNSGISGRPPFMQVVTVVQDDTALMVGLNGAAQATYYDESKMTVGTATPPLYDRNGVGLEVVRPGETIHKAATRLAARTGTTAPSDLESANPDNLPWLQFAVSLTGSPVAVATYTINATAGGNTQTYSGDLMVWRSPQTSAGATIGTVFFDLPLDSVRIPMLTTAPGAVSVKVAVDVTDAAGNKGGDQLELTYQVIGPPLNVIVDSGYPGFGARNSAYPYKIVDGTYGALFNAGDFTTFGAVQQVRLARLVVTNPEPQPVALDVSGLAGGTWSMTETWSGNQSGITGTATFNDRTCPADNGWATKHATMYAALGGTLVQGDPTAASVGWTGVAATSNLASLAELRDGSALAKVGGRYVVPAASGSAPGVISLYTTRPLVVSRPGPALGPWPYRNDRATLYTFASETNNSVGCCAQGLLTTTYYKYNDCIICGGNKCSLSYRGSSGLIGTGTYCVPGPVSCPVGGWFDTNNGPGTPCTNCMGTCSCSQWTQAQTYNTSTYYQQLSAATEAVSVIFAPITQATDGSGNVYGVANSGAASVAVSSSFTH